MRKLLFSSIAVAALVAVGYWTSSDYLQVVSEPLSLIGKSSRHLGHKPPSKEDERRHFKNFVAQTPAYPTSVTPWPISTLGDGSTPYGGTAPAENAMPDILSNFNRDGWFRFLSGSIATIDGVEAKFRTHCEYSHNAYADPLIYPGKYNISHLHTFFGNTQMGPDSTFESLRKTGGSTCGGGILNRSGYWYPAILKDNALGDGNTMVLKPQFATVYYNVGKALADTNRVSRIPRGLGYVFGFNPADPDDTTHTAEVTSANIGASGAQYFYKTNGFAGWSCEGANGSNANSPVPGSATQPYLRNADGTATLTCLTSTHIQAALNGPTCWDGRNLLSPNGRRHVRQFIRNNGTAAPVNVAFCPNGWYQIAQFELIMYFKHNGESDYKEWYLSSDRMTDAAFIHPAQPCHASNITNGIDGSFCNGQTMHSDWFGAWDDDAMKTWMRECNGTTVEGVAGTSRSCISSQLGDGRRMIHQSENAPDRSRVPQLTLTGYDLTTRWEPMPRGGPNDGSP